MNSATPSSDPLRLVKFGTLLRNRSGEGLVVVSVVEGFRSGRPVITHLELLECKTQLLHEYLPEEIRSALTQGLLTIARPNRSRTVNRWKQGGETPWRSDE
ncbi:hypothetical protein BLX24_07940 [Arsenicibacter rosenii]|uniref:Uncharacterized protein n=1 Tax=Arsenicibacter rosenii TaxID=1750698 RepID=A0A1S2VPR2_9BACT|nr:hypothetical protein BLX24_07940 [Arsenicibacter rosenii]